MRGRTPQKAGEILISEDFARRLNVGPGDTATLISGTMTGSMAVANFTVTGTLRFGMEAMDRGAMIADIADIQAALDMEDAAGEILGFFGDFVYRDPQARESSARFNSALIGDADEFAPVMDTLSQAGMADLLAMMRMFSGLVLVVFIGVMSIVLWNAGLMGSLRRYGEIGVRLAMGETKTHIYATLIGEALMIGALGTVIGTAVGLAVSYYLAGAWPQHRFHDEERLSFHLQRDAGQGIPGQLSGSGLFRVWRRRFSGPRFRGWGSIGARPPG